MRAGHIIMLFDAKKRCNTNKGEWDAMPFLNILLLICTALCTLISLYFAFTCVAGLFLRKRSLPATEPERRIAAVIAARNEAAVVGKLVESLMNQDYPRALFDVYVVPNNCEDDTEAVARAAGAKILRCTGEIRGKGDVLRQAFSQLTAMDSYDAYCVFDADNLVDRGFFRAVNDARAAGYHVAQGYRDSKNPFDSWMSGSMTVFYWFMSGFYNESRARLGLSCALNGTGFMVSDAAIRAIGWNTHTLTEDLEFTALSALHGYKIGWMPRAVTYDEQTSTLWASCVQRRRWTAGSVQCMKRYALPLLRRNTASSRDVGILFLGNMVALIGLPPTIWAVWELAKRVLTDMAHGPMIIAASLGGLAFSWAGASLVALALFAVHRKLNRRCIPAILLFPVFLFTWAPINLYAVLTPPPEWKQIRHTRSLDQAEMERLQ